MVSSTAPIPLDPNFQLKVAAFEGPLDLLLYLIQKHELEILDLPVAFVVERYLEYLSLMKQLDLDVASEYLLMAATLTHIKSKMLLPKSEYDVKDDEADAEEIDPRAELIRRLLEYQKYKAAAEALGSRSVQGRDVFARGISAPESAGEPPVASFGLFRLLDAFQAVLKRTNKPLSFEVTSEGIGIQERMTELVEFLKVRRTCQFEDLFSDVSTVYDLVVTFLAILEMAKRRFLSVFQANVNEALHLELRIHEETTDAVPDELSPDAEYV